MKSSKLLVILSLLSLSLGFGQSLEESIYNALDRFVENPSLASLQQLEEKETAFFNQAQTENEHLALVVLNSNLGYYQRQFGNTQKAVRHYEKAWKSFRRRQLNGYDIIEYCLKPLGNLYTMTGNFTNAESTIKHYIALAEKQDNTPQKIAGLLNLSVVYHNTGKHNTAIELLREGLHIKGISSQQRSALENNLATNLMALKNFEEAQMLLENKNPQSSTGILLRNKARLALQQGDTKKALSLLEEAEKTVLNDVPPARELARFYVEKATYFAQINNTGKATENYHKALQFLLPATSFSVIPEQEMLYAENTFITIFDGLARLQNNRVKALGYYDLSFYVSGLLSGQYTAQEVKILHRAAIKNRTERCLEILFELYSNTGDNRFTKQAFVYAERSKAAVLREVVSQKSLLESNPDDTLLQKREQLSALQEQKINALIREQLTTADPEKLQMINDTLSILSLTLKDLQSAITKKYPDTGATVISLNKLQTKIEEDNAVLISYFFGKEGMYRFEISANEVNFIRTAVDETLHKQVSGFIGYFENSLAINNDVPGFKEHALSLYKSLLPETLPKGKNLILIPDGLLHFIPFEAMLTGSSKNASFANMPFLVKQNSVGYNTSATLYHDAKIPDTGNSVLGVFPVFEDSPQPLTYSLDEAENLNHLMNPRLLMHREASKKNFIAFAKTHSILHLSTHAHSGNFTIPAAMEFHDDVMLLQEFYSLNLNPKLVVLSACETGIGKIQSGEGAMSLARGFQYAGAQNLLFSLWKVNDLSTSQLMTSFYERYRKKHSAFMANRHSKLEYLDNQEIPNSKKSPYYWSGFVYYGALEEETKSPNFVLIYGALFLILMTVYFIFRRKITSLFKDKK